LSQKFRNRSSNSIKVNQGYFREKNSEFFYRHFDGKTLENQRKTAKKTPQKTVKKVAFFDVFLSAPICE